MPCLKIKKKKGGGMWCREETHFTELETTVPQPQGFQREVTGRSWLYTTQISITNNNNSF